MLKFLLGVAVGASVATMFSHVYREREKQQLVYELARLHEMAQSDRPGL